MPTDFFCRSRWLRRAALAFALLIALPAAADAQRLVLLVRHAERADGGSPPAGMTTPADPDLSSEGKQRAEALARMLAQAGITKIVATQYRRTQQTARPLADRRQLSVETIPSSDVDGLVSRLRTAYANEIVLVVGHSTSLPKIVAALGGPAITIAETDYGNLFVFVPATKVLTTIRY